MCLSRTAHALLACAVPIAVILVLFCGCQKTARDLPLDKDVARQSLTAFLESWSQGQPPESLQARVPAIVGVDPDWRSGRRLVQFETESEMDDGTNMHITTKLVFGSERGQDPAATVTYIVGTSPVITIFRNE